MEIDNKDWDNYIIACLNNTIGKEDKIALEEWMSSNSDNLAYFNQIRKIWNILQITENCKDFDSDRAFALFQDKIKYYTSENSRVIHNDIPEKKIINWKNYIKYAAVITVCILVGYGILQKRSSSPIYSGISQIVVPKGSKTDMMLLDGTHVTLNSGSKIELASDFGNKDRVIKLQGEACFTVAHDSLRPFFVEAGDIRVKVLGTKFNINAYSTNEEIRVFLIEGSVEMNTFKSEPVKLKPNQTAIYNTKSQMLLLEEFSEIYSLGWLNDKLMFSNESFEQIAYRLERKFDIKINIHNNSIKKQRFTGDFVNDETIEQIFKIILSDNRYHYKINKSEVDIY